MKPIVLILVSVTLLGLGVAAEPRLVALQPDFDFGFIPQNSTVQHRYLFHSTGTDTVRISDIKTGCACAVMPLEREWIAPGDSMEVTITWELGRAIGGVFRAPKVFTNMGPDPVRLKLTGIVVSEPDSIRPVTVVPFRLLLGKSSIKDVDSLPFTLANHTARDITVTLVSAPPDQVELNTPTTIGAKAQATGYVRLKSEFLESEFDTSITMAFNDERKSRLTLPIKRKFYLAESSK